MNEATPLACTICGRTIKNTRAYKEFHRAYPMCGACHKALVALAIGLRNQAK